MQIHEIKRQVRALQKALAELGIEKSYNEVMQLVARQHGLKNWQVLRAMADEDQYSTFSELADAIQEGGVDRVLLARKGAETKVFWLGDVALIALATIDKEIRGEASADDLAWLTSANNGIVFDLGEEYNPDAKVSIGELRNAKAFADGVWKLKDGRVLSFLVSSPYPANLPESSPRKAADDVLATLEINLTELLPEHDVPEAVPEWQWVANEASFKHVGNNKTPGVWEFMVRVPQEDEDFGSPVPVALTPVVQHAKQVGAIWMLFHQG